MSSEKKTVRTVLISVLAGAAAMALVINLFFGGTRLTRSEYKMLKSSAMLGEIMQLSQETFYGELPTEEEMLSAAADAMVASLNDPYAVYYTAEEYAAYQSRLSGEYDGIGVTVAAAQGGGAVIVNVNSGGPAQKAGLKVGDILIAVEGEDVTSLKLSEITKLIREKEGGVINLTLLRGEEKLELSVMREKQLGHQVYHEMMEDGIGYIYINRFAGDCLEGFQTALSELKENGMRALVLDVRRNPGGILDIVVQVADLLMPKGIILTEREANGVEHVYRSDAKCLDVPIVILTNGASASASELLAGALQDSGSGIVVGENTYGKGVVQTTRKLEESDSYLKLTTAAYYTPSGRCIDGIGVAPDIKVELPEEWANVSVTSIPREADTQLAAALEYLSGELK